MKLWLKDKKYFATSYYNKSTNNILDVNIKSKKLLSKSDISKFMKNFDLNEKIRILATETESKPKKDKIEKLQTYD